MPKSEMIAGRHPGARLHAIKSLNVKKLFGRIDLQSIYFSSSDTISFLYGENGIGKTTILKMIYAVLSPVRSDGLRSLLGETKFREFGIDFYDGQKIRVLRKGNSFSGAYEYQFSGPRVNDIIAIKKEDIGTSSPWPNEKRERIERLGQYLESLAPRIIFVNDRRTVRSSYGPWDIRKIMRSNSFETGEFYAEPSRPDLDELVAFGLDNLLAATAKHFSEMALQGNKRANIKAGKIYLDIAKASANHHRNAKIDAKAAVLELNKKCDNISTYIQKYGKYNILEADTVPEIQALISNLSPAESLRLFYIVEPYLSSLDQRILEVSNISDQIYAFETSINNFLRRKEIEVRLNEPICIKSKNEDLSLASLSSGEQHLLYLCCCSALAWESPTLILLDEPELSMSYKWQKRVMPALLAITAPSTQFIVATHSFEIISSNRDNVVPLKEI